MTDYVLDTAVFLWSLGPSERLNRKAREILEDGGQRLFFSVVSAWEVSIKFASGKLKLPEIPSLYVPSRIKALGLRQLPILTEHALLAGGLPAHHLDPFDRMLIAQAQTEGLTLMSADPLFKSYDVEILWCGK